MALESEIGCDKFRGAKDSFRALVKEDEELKREDEEDKEYCRQLRSRQRHRAQRRAAICEASSPLPPPAH